MQESGSRADRIRMHTRLRYVEPARRAGKKTVAVRAGDVARDWGLNNRVPSICSALESRLFLEQAGLRLLERRGPYRSTTTEFHYAILDEPAKTGRDDGGADQSAAPRPASKLHMPEPSMSRAVRSGEERGNRIYLVSCVKTKLASPALAKDLYISPWFRKARACVEKTGRPWHILSAQYGLVHPDERIRPYEKTLKTMPVAERRTWAGLVLADIEPSLPGVDTVVFFAGESYREFLDPALRSRGLAVSVPMARLSQGRQLEWLNANLHG